jgi:hypothetical protein
MGCILKAELKTKDSCYTEPVLSLTYMSQPVA